MAAAALCDLQAAGGLHRDIMDLVLADLKGRYDAGIRFCKLDAQRDLGDIWDAYNYGCWTGFRHPLRVFPYEEWTTKTRWLSLTWNEAWDDETIDEVLEGFPAHRLVLDYTGLFMRLAC